jgi:hypothetical protein
LEGVYVVHRYLLPVVAAMLIAGPAGAIIYENGMDNTLNSNLGTEDVTVRNNLDTGDFTTLTVVQGAIADDFSSNGTSVILLEGGQTGQLTCRDSATILIEGGNVTGTVTSNDECLINILGSNFRRPDETPIPLGPLTESGTLLATLESGKAFNTLVEVGAGGTVFLPEPGGDLLSLLAVAGLGGLVARSRRRAGSQSPTALVLMRSNERNRGVGLG